ncbi:MAG: peptidoglycan-binding protein [Patescibacteria group bacterium]
MRTTPSFFLTLTLIMSIALFSSAPHLEAATKRTSKVTFEETVSVDDLAASYAEASAGGQKVRILIMPGHEPDFGGAEFMGYYERELVVDIANKLATELRTDANFEVFVARGMNGWNDDFTYYFDKHGRKIERFVEDHKETMEKLEKRKKLEENDAQAAHNEARSDVALRLYGVNKWANENDIDLVLHLHLNDETGHGANAPGAYSGSAIYIPDSIFGNAKASKAIAEPIFERLNATNATSTFGLETSGILEDRELIAIGAYNTSEVPSLLIEYGYIYEPRITGDGARSEVLTDFAFQTAQGVKDFFGSPGRPRFSTKVLPYQFASDVLATSTPKDARGVYALQAALHSLGYYPGTEAALSVCPVSGITNECMAPALRAFQKAKGLEQTGTFGPATRAALNSSFGLATPAAAPVAAVAPQAPVVQAAPVCSAFTNTLEEDATDASTNGEVTRLQTILAKDTAVYPEGKVTGYFGPATVAAVKRFQVKNEIVKEGADGYGIIGPRTLKVLVAQCAQ